MSFDLQAFITAPSQELLDLAKKSDLLDIAAHYELTTVNKSMLKQEIKNILVQFLVDKEILDSSALSLVLVTQTGLQMRELEIQKQIELEKLRLEQEKLRMEMEERVQKERMEMEEREKEKERQMQKERMEMEDREKEKERQIQIEREKIKFDTELRMKELEMQNMTVKRQPLESGVHFDITKHIRLVPPFQEKEVDKYFLHFEKVAENLKWPKEHWTLLLQSVIIGKAREIYTQLTVQQSSSYDTVKELILKAYELVPEAYRQKFRNCKKENEQTYVEFARTKEQLFDRWCSSKKIGSDHENLRQLMLVEEFTRCINSDIKSFLDEKQVETLEAAARLADDYALTHKVSFINKSNPLEDHFSHIQDPNIVLVIHLAVIAKQFLPNPNLLVKIKIKIPYLNQFAIIAKGQAILYLNVYIGKERKKNKRGLNLLALPLYGQNHSHVLRRKILSRPKGLRLILLWRFMNHSYQMVLCH